MHICLACDDQYAPHVEVVIRSVFAHVPAGGARIALISDGVSAPNLGRIRSLCQGFGAELHTIEIGQALSNLDIEAGHLTRAALGRLFIPKIILEEKTVYLDVDTVCAASLQPLWDTEMGGRCAMMVESPWPRYRDHKLTIGLDAGDPYFNSGVMVIDVDKMRRISFFERAMEIAYRGKAMLAFADQDVVNLLLRGDVRPLHPRWNVATSLFHWRPGQTLTYGAVEAQDAVRSPAVIHYTGSRKPWHPDCEHPYADAFRAYGRGDAAPPEGPDPARGATDGPGAAL